MKADELADLLLFWSARENKMVTLAEYAAAMPEGQKAIYYAAGDDRERLAKMPVVKGVLDRGYDVLLLTADVDEFTFQAMRGYTAKHMPKVYEDDAAREAAAKAVADGAEPETEDRFLELKNVATGDLDLATEDEKKDAEEATKEHGDLFEAMKEALGDKVEKVAVSARLTDAPACITTEGPLSLEMEKVLARGPEPIAARCPRVSACLSSTPSIRCSTSSWLLRRRATRISSPCMPVCSTTRRCSSRASCPPTRWRLPRASASSCRLPTCASAGSL